MSRERRVGCTHMSVCGRGGVKDSIFIYLSAAALISRLWEEKNKMERMIDKVQKRPKPIRGYFSLWEIAFPLKFCLWTETFCRF